MSGVPTTTRRLRAACAALLAAAVLASCTVADGAGRQQVQGTVRPQYIALAESVVAHGGRAWVEADLLKAWQAGPQRYASVLDTVTRLADRPGVDGVKIADELGYGDGTDPRSALEFLRSATAALHQRLPGRKVLVDLIVPELGCLAWRENGGSATPTTDGRSPEAQCAAREVARNPAASLAAVDTYVALGGLDVVDLSAGLRSESEYADWGTTRDAAMAEAWDEASRRWGGTVRLQARKALAHPGPYEGTAATAEADVRTYVDIPLRHGAKAVDVWTWSQPYKGSTYTLTDPGLGANPLVAALRSRRDHGVQLWTHMTPSSLQVGLDADVTAALTIFSGVLVASGTG